MAYGEFLDETGHASLFIEIRADFIEALPREWHEGAALASGWLAFQGDHDQPIPSFWREADNEKLCGLLAQSLAVAIKPGCC